MSDDPTNVPASAEDSMGSLFHPGARMGLKFAANISMMFKELTNLKDRYQEASKRGFTAVECQFPYDSKLEELITAKHDAKVEHVLINSFQGSAYGDIGFACHPNRREDFRKSLDLTILYAKGLNCKKVHIMAGAIPPGVTMADLEQMYIRNLVYAAELFQKEGIMGLIEPLCSKTRPDYFLQSYEKALHFVKEVNSRNIRLLLDVYHLQMIHGNLTTNISQLARYVGHVQISQAPNRNEPDSAGEIDYKYILDLFEELGYRDYIGLEYAPSDKTASSLRWLKDWNYMPNIVLSP